MNELIEGMLAVSAWFAPVDWAGVVINRHTVPGRVFAVTLHRELLEISWKTLEVLVVGQYGNRLGAEEVAVPDAEQPHQHWHVALKRRRAEMLVHLMEAGEHVAEIIRPDGDHGREPDGR